MENNDFAACNQQDSFLFFSGKSTYETYPHYYAMLLVNSSQLEDWSGCSD